MPSSQIVSNRAILFLPIRSISELFSFLDHPKAIFSEDFFVLSFQLSFSKSYRCIVQISSNQFVISLFSYIYIPSSIFIHFSKSSWWIVPLLLWFLILTVVRSRFLFLRYHIKLFVVSILPVVRWRPSQVCAISILILSTRISSMPKIRCLSSI